MVAEAVERIDAIDGLRAVAVLAVLTIHFAGENVLPGGGVGVDLFFVISGYLITASLLRESSSTGRIALGQFYRRRFYRIAPAFLVMAGAVSLLAIGLASSGYAVPGFATDLLFSLTSTMNIARATEFTGGGLLGHTWSLSIEEQFYLIWPVTVMLAIAMVGRQKLVWVAVALTIGVVIWRIAVFADEASVLRIYNGTDTRADALLVGCLLAVVGTRWAVTFVRMWWWVPITVLAGAVLLVGWRSNFFPLGGYTIVAMASAWLVALVVENEPKTSAALRAFPAVWIGRRSYSLYLWHFPLLVLLGYFERSVLATAAAVSASFILADLSYRLIETPAIRRGRRIANLLTQSPVAAG